MGDETADETINFQEGEFKFKTTVKNPRSPIVLAEFLGHQNGYQSVPAHIHGLEHHHVNDANHPPIHNANHPPIHDVSVPHIHDGTSVTTHELPAPYGCRSIATKECHKVPIIVPKKVPFETCIEVPTVDCFLVLKMVPELECTPEVYEECNDFEKKIPYLAPEEECEEIFFDECQEIEERVPVELCRNIRVDEESVSIHRGRTIRKEGEKRRRKTSQKIGIESSFTNVTSTRNSDRERLRASRRRS